MSLVVNGVEYESTVTDVAKRFQYSEAHVRLLASRGAIPSMKRGRKYYFQMAEVEKAVLTRKGAESDLLEGV